jgi:hypothetical protein
MPCWLTSTIDSLANFDTDGNKIGFYSGSDCRFDTTRDWVGEGEMGVENPQLAKLCLPGA